MEFDHLSWHYWCSNFHIWIIHFVSNAAALYFIQSDVRGSLELLQGLHLHYCMQQHVMMKWSTFSILLWVLIHVQTAKGLFKGNKSPLSPLPEPSDSQWCGSSRIQFRCITLLMLLKWPQRLSAGREVKQDHLLLFLEKLPAWLIHRQRPFVSHLQCKTHVKQDAAHTSHVCVIWWIRSGYYRNRRWRDCLQAVLGLLFFFTVRTFSTTLNSRVLDMNKHLHKQFTCLHLKPI